MVSVATLLFSSVDDDVSGTKAHSCVVLEFRLQCAWDGKTDIVLVVVLFVTNAAVGRFSETRHTTKTIPRSEDGRRFQHFLFSDHDFFIATDWEFRAEYHWIKEQVIPAVGGLGKRQMQ